ncbi:MAG: N-formylglutamate amidohydrolase [Sphingomonadales bacterium]|jgi:N-formylglutamate amidohydrolase|nr:N-formylglutamate amidohydrolase [Sphingomonadales bacterium]
MSATKPTENAKMPAQNGFSAFNCDDLQFPVLLSVPHAGRIYPLDLTGNLRLDPAQLVRLEDRYADRLAATAIKAGLPTLVAHYARAWIDLNRDSRDVDPAMVEGGFANSLGSAKMRGGLGLIPRRLMQYGDIWKRQLRREDIDHRIGSYHAPYHDLLEQLLSQIVARHGVAILVDLHSMPPLGAEGEMQPQIVIGDRFGQSAASVYSELLAARLNHLGVRVALNHPYPGDYILRRHGAQKRNIHALQIEVDRRLYLDADLREPSADIGDVAAMIAELLFLLIEQARGASLPVAAE